MAVAEYGERSNKKTKDTEKAMRDLAEKVGRYMVLCPLFCTYNYFCYIVFMMPETSDEANEVFRIFNPFITGMNSMGMKKQRYWLPLTQGRRTE